MRFQGDILKRPEGSGFVKQIFGWPVHENDNPSRASFDEFQARPSADAQITFSGKTAAELYEAAQELHNSDERQSMIDWSLMPDDWEPPTVQE